MSGTGIQKRKIECSYRDHAVDEERR